MIDIIFVHVVYLIYIFLAVLSTQAMLGSLMGVAALDSSVDWLGSGAAAATINWVLKDGLGQAGGIFLVSLLGSRLDSHARFLRFHSSFLLVAASLLELAIPATEASWFLPLASTANVLKNVSWMVSSATRAHFMKQMAKWENIGDLTGKAASQMTLASLIGTGLGLLILRTGPTHASLFSYWLLNALVTIFAAFKSGRWAISRQLNPSRIHSIVKTTVQCHVTDPDQLARYIWTPEIVAERENFILPASLSTDFLAINTSLDQIQTMQLNWIVPMDRLHEEQFCLASLQANPEKFFIWTLSSATPTNQLIATITATLLHFKLPINPKLFIAAMKKQGWDTESFQNNQFKENSLTLLNNKDVKND